MCIYSLGSHLVSNWLVLIHRILIIFFCKYLFVSIYTDVENRVQKYDENIYTASETLAGVVYLCFCGRPLNQPIVFLLQE